MSEYDESPRSGPFSCPSCGGRTVFDPASQQLRCPYCGTLKAFQLTRETPNEYDIHFAPPESDAAWIDETRVVRCGGCGAEFIETGETEVGKCPFCGSDCLNAEPAKAGIAPESVIPFRITRRQAQERFRDWIKGHPFVCRTVKKQASKGNVTGVYLPYWTYVDEAVSTYEGKAGHHYQGQIPYTVTDPDGKERTENRSEQLTRWERASRTIEQRFDDVMIRGSERLPENMLNSVMPWRFSQLMRYVPEFIAGYVCEKPVTDVQAGWQQAQGLVDRRLAELAERDILSSADEAQVRQLETEHRNIRYRLTLLPMYLNAYTYRKKQRHVLINGQTGAVAGHAPVSPLRVAAAVLFGLLLLGGLFALFMSRGGSDYMFNDLSEIHRVLL